MALVQPGDEAALLVDADEQRIRSGGRLERRDERLDLRGRLDVPNGSVGRGVEVEEDHATESPVADVLHDRGSVVDGEATEADQQHLPDPGPQVGLGGGRGRRRR